MPPDATFSLPAPFGQGSWPNTVPIAGDWDGDGVDGIGTFSLATSNWVLKNTVGAGAADVGPFTFGTPSVSYPVVGDWGAVGFDTPGVITVGGVGWTVRTASVTGGATLAFNFSAPGSAAALPMVWCCP